jgi:DNA-binding LacI/PurR family transcriptional regulator
MPQDLGETLTSWCHEVIGSEAVTNRLTEIAVYTGLSESTISRVLNNREGVADATRAAVLTAVDALGYERPNRLKTLGDPIAGIVMPQFENPIFPAFATALGGQLTQRGYVPLVGVVESAGPSEADYVRTLLDRHVAGMVFVSGLHAVTGIDHSHYLDLIKRRLPVVAINGLTDDLDMACVSTDDRESVILAARHLTQLGHTRLGLAIADSQHIPGLRKQSAFSDFVSDNPGVEGTVDHSLYSLEGGMTAATHLIQSGVTGIICASDVMALGAVKAARKLNLRVPQDISVIGFDDSSFMAMVDPPVTTIRQPVEALTRAAVGLLVAQTAGREFRTGEILFEPELVVRGSTGPPST